MKTDVEKKTKKTSSVAIPDFAHDRKNPAALPEACSKCKLWLRDLIKQSDQWGIVIGYSSLFSTPCVHTARRHGLSPRPVPDLFPLALMLYRSHTTLSPRRFRACKPYRRHFGLYSFTSHSFLEGTQ